MLRRTRFRTNPLALTGTLTAAVYLIICLFYRRGPSVYSHTTRELFAWFFCISLLVLFWRGYQQINRADKSPLRIIVCFAAVFALFTFLTVPFHSTDVFGYINRGWQQVHYTQNPYVYHLNDIPNWQADPMLREHWIYNPNPYGFLFTLLARLIAIMSGGNWWAALAMFKAVNLITFAAIGWILWQASSHVSYLKPEVALYLFLWSPLIQLHHLANGHNDLLVGFCVALAAYLAITERYFWIVPALVAATLLKFAPLTVLPPALFLVIKKSGWKTAVLSSLVGLMLAVAVAFPYLRDWQVLKLADMQDNATLIDNSLHSFLIHIFENLARVVKALAPFHEIVNSAIKLTLRGGLIIFLLYQWLKRPRNFSAEDFNGKAVLILFVLICVVSSKFNAWYMGMILPAALLRDEQYWLRRLVVLISCTELLSLTFFKQAYMLNYFALILIPMLIVWRQRNNLAEVSAGEIESDDAILPAA
jgi:hypothetical protein